MFQGECNGKNIKADSDVVGNRRRRQSFRTEASLSYQDKAILAAVFYMSRGVRR